VSNPDFPGPPWQDRAGFPEPRGYGAPDAGYGRSADGGRDSYDGGQGNRGQGRGYDNGRGFHAKGRGYDDRAGYRSNGRGSGAGNGRDPYSRDPYSRNGGDQAGYDRYPARGGAGVRSRGDYESVGSRKAGRRAGARRAGSRRRYGQVGYDRQGLGPGADHNGYGNGQYGYGPDGYGHDGFDPGRGRMGRAIENVDERLRAFRDRHAGKRGLRERPPGNWLQRQWRANWWRHWTLKKAALVAGGLAALMLLVPLGGFFYVYSSVALPLSTLQSPPQQSSIVYFADGKTPIGCFCNHYRTALDIPHLTKNPYLEEAFLAAEDRNFFHEGGISLTGTARALMVDVTGGGTQGGSTITEQFIKSYLDPYGVGLTFKQKIKEIILAIKLARVESKPWILQHYLNAIYLGGGAWGVEAAAETYFGRHAWQLSIAQSAMIAAMVQQPSGFEPAHPTYDPGLGYSLLDRWVYVLGNMARDTPGITQQQYNALVPYPPDSPQHIQADLQHFPKADARSQSWTGYRYYLMNLVQNELQAYYHIPPADLQNRGLQIYTTINEHLMTELNSSIRYDKKQIGQYAAQQYGKIALPRWVHIGAVLEQPKTGAIKAFYAGPGFGTKHCVFCDNATGTILQPVQVGSSFKPYVLTTAVSQGMNAQTSILNSHQTLCIPPADWPGAQGIAYQHQKSSWSIAHCNTHIGYYLLNQPGEINHPLKVPLATAYSSNPAFEDLIHRTGVYPVLDMAGKLGVNPSTVHGLKKLFGPGGQYPGSVTAALGQGSLTVVDQANAFATLVSNGITALPHVIQFVTQGGNKLPVPSAYTPRKLLAPNVAADADYALSFDTVLGGATGTNANIGRPTVAKTGTLGQLNNASQAWFIGAIPQYSFAVTLYADKPAHEILNNLPSIGGWAGEYGGAWPATMWHNYMSTITAGLPVKQLPVPNFNPPQFSKWNQAPKVKPQCKGNQQGGPGGGGGQGGNGNGNGHHHHGLFWQFAQLKPKPKNCQKNGGGPGPGPSPTPSPTSSPSPSPNPSVSPSPNPSPTGGHGIAPATTPGSGTSPARAPKPAKGLASGGAVTTAAVLPRPVVLRSAWAVWLTGMA